MEKQYRNASEDFEKQFNDEEKSIVHVISVETSDRYGDIVRADGMDKSHYEKNPVVLYGHDSRGFPVGKSLWQKKTTLPNGKKAIIAKTKFADTEDGDTTYKLWKDGFLNAASIGFMPKTYDAMIENNRFIGYDIKEWELLEYSIVPIPANQEALRLELEKMGDNLVVKSLRDEMRRTQDEENAKREIEEIKAQLSIIAELSEAIKSVASQLAELKENDKIINKHFAEIVAEKEQQRTKELIADSVRRAISEVKK